MSGEDNDDRITKLKGIVELQDTRTREMCGLIKDAEQIIRKNLHPWPPWGAKVILFLTLARIRSGEK